MDDRIQFQGGRGDTDDRAVYLQFRDSLRSLLELIDRFEELDLGTQQKLQNAHPMLLSWDEQGRQDLRNSLQAIVEGVQGLANAQPPPWAQ
jgi:hypothetical protein